MSRTIRFWFDFVSPYSYLALTQAESFADEHNVNWEVRPVLYGAILDATGLVGPAEQPAKRDYTARDVMRSADRLGVPLVGPPRHPFNPIAALRAVCLHQDESSALALAHHLAATCWGQGRALTEMETIESVLSETGFETDDLEARVAALDNKARLRTNTSDAIEAGVFGVPTFGWDGELFWGHDRLVHLADRLAGRIPDPQERASLWADRPRGVDRSGSPWHSRS